MHSYVIGKYGLERTEAPVAASTDGLGFVWIWEQPSSRYDYVVAVDPTGGITGWTPYSRTEDENRVDNACIQVLRCGEKNVQVAEYTAPIDAGELAIFANALGRVYGGRNEEGQAQVIVEVTGPGIETQRELISRFGYSNIYVWTYLDDFALKRTTKFGWYSSTTSRQLLWSRGVRHIHKGGVVINSPWLIEEMAGCTTDTFLAVTARARAGGRDDRVMAFLLALWAANMWSFSVEPSEAAQAETGGKPDWQASDISLDALHDEWESRFAELGEE